MSRHYISISENIPLFLSESGFTGLWFRNRSSRLQGHLVLHIDFICVNVFPL